MLTEEQIKHYKLENRNGWYYSQQGLILTDDENENIRGYLSEVYRLNEIDDKNQKEFELMKKFQRKCKQ
jgi:hypothetical protein